MTREQLISILDDFINSKLLWPELKAYLKANGFEESEYDSILEKVLLELSEETLLPVNLKHYSDLHKN